MTDPSQADLWVLKHGSGTLQRARELDLAWNTMYLCERTAFVFGYGFTPLFPSRFTAGKLLAECDTKAITETLWFCRVLNARWPLLRALPAYLHTPDGEGAGITLSGELPDWLGGRVPVALVAKIGADGKYEKTINPC